MKTFNLLSRLGIICAAAVILVTTSCKKDRSETLGEGPDVKFYALTADNRIMTYNAKNVGNVTAQFAISGLQTGETILGIDCRPATGELYGVGSTSRIYVINPATGAARAINATPFTPAIAGTSVGFDFNPTVDRIRLVTNTGQNLRINPETGAVQTTDGVINGAANASVTAVAYNGNTSGSTTTTLFDIDITNDKLYKQDPPNNGTLVEIGSLGIDVQAAGGFDISPDGTVALAALTQNNANSLYGIDLTTGKATRYNYDFGTTIVGLAIPTDPVAYAISANNELMIFNPMNPNPVLKTISGVQAGETILGIDFRPVNGQLYGIGSTSRLYTINTSSGVSTQVGTGQLTTLLTGTNFAFDFNPTVDRIRLISNTGQNLRLNPNDGTVAAIDGNISIATANVTGAAYTNNFAGATTTVLFDIDTQSNRLYRQDPPNNGTLVDVGPLGITVTASNGFDIGSTSGTAYALLTIGTTTRVYTINLNTGAATPGATVTGTPRAFTLGLGF